MKTPFWDVETIYELKLFFCSFLTLLFTDNKGLMFFSRHYDDGLAAVVRRGIAGSRNDAGKPRVFFIDFGFLLVVAAFDGEHNFSSLTHEEELDDLPVACCCRANFVRNSRMM